MPPARAGQPGGDAGRCSSRTMFGAELPHERGNHRVGFDDVAKRLTQVHPQGAIRDRVRSLPKRFRKRAAEDVAAEWELHVEGEVYTISVIERACHVREGPSLAPTFTVTTDAE